MLSFRSPFLVVTIIFSCIALLEGCRPRAAANENVQVVVAQTPPPLTPTPGPTPSSSPAFPNLQAELLDKSDKTTQSPIGSFDFKNYKYQLPRGWQNPDGSDEIALKNGRVAPVEVATSDEMDPDEKAEAKRGRRIGMSYVTTKFFDVTGDGQDEALVILKVETGGSAIPQFGYVYTWKAGAPQLLWLFRTGDRADGGLKDVRQEAAEMVVELYGQDRFLLGGAETAKITGDEEQLCCPTSFTRTRYKWNGTSFLMQGKRLTFSMSDHNAPPEENLGDKVNAPQKGKK